MSDGVNGEDDGDLPGRPSPDLPPPVGGVEGHRVSGPEPRPEVVVPGGHPLASPWLRIGARLIDALILLTAGFVMTGLFSAGGESAGTGITVGYAVVLLLLGIAYEIGFVGARGGTPGKLVLGLRIVTQENGTTPPGWDKAGLRYVPDLAGLVPVIGGLLSLGITIVSIVWLFTDDHRRTVYDRVAGTYVVKV